MYATAAAARTVQYTLFSGEPYAPTSPCGNCSYTIPVDAPALRCDEKVSNESLAFAQTGLDLWWQGVTVGPQWDTGEVHKLKGQLAVRWGNRSYWNTDINTFPTFLCSLYNATYTIDMSFNGSGARDGVASVARIDYWSEYPWSANNSDVIRGTPDAVQASNFEAIKDSVYAALNGTMFSAGEGFAMEIIPSTLTVMLSNLAISYNESGVDWAADLPGSVEQLMSNVTLSLVAQNLNKTNTIPTECTNHISRTIFKYNPTTLLATYGSGLTVCFITLVLGLSSLYSNGFGGNTGFATWLEATRNPELTTESVNKDTKLRYGRLRSGHRAFGTEEGLRGSVDLGEMTNEGDAGERLPFLDH